MYTIKNINPIFVPCVCVCIVDAMTLVDIWDVINGEISLSQVNVNTVHGVFNKLYRNIFEIIFIS